MRHAGSCNLLSLSDKTVIGLGINITKTRLLLSALSVLIGHTSTEMLRHYQDVDIEALRRITDAM